jgi:hypothetical protein
MWRERFAFFLGVLIQGLSWFLILIGGLGFWFADRALHEFGKMSWGLAELVGMGGSVVCLILGVGLRSLRDC